MYNSLKDFLKDSVVKTSLFMFAAGLSVGFPVSSMYRAHMMGNIDPTSFTSLTFLLIKMSPLLILLFFFCKLANDIYKHWIEKKDAQEEYEKWF